MVDIISVTGTKGKTTVSRIIADALSTVRDPVLLVDTSGAYINGRQEMSLRKSFDIFDVVPTVSPGKMLTLLNDYSLINAVAVLETAIGSSASIGLGYRRHKVGVITNILEDHIGDTKRIQSRQDIADAKDFIFRKLDQRGAAVFNSDEELIVKKLNVIPKSRQAELIPCGLKLNDFIDKHLNNGGSWVTCEDGYVKVKNKHDSEKIAKIDDISWTFHGEYQPSLYNLMFVIGALRGYFNGFIPQEVVRRLTESKLDKNGGRLAVFDSKDGVKIIADYAHEKYSFIEIAKLAKSFTNKDGKIIGVLRMAYNRSDALIKDTAENIAPYYDKYVIYDKVDGYWKKPDNNPRNKYPKVTGKISKTFYEALLENHAKAERIIREDLAIERAAKLAKRGDVVVVIVNDDIVRSTQFIKESFNIQED